VNDLSHFVEKMKQDKNKELKELAHKIDHKVKFNKVPDKQKVQETQEREDKLKT